jgi:hypothetical protein
MCISRRDGLCLVIVFILKLTVFCFVYKSVCMPYVVLLFYLLLHESVNKMSFRKESNKTNVSVERFNLELTCVEVRDQYEIVKIC